MCKKIKKPDQWVYVIEKCNNQVKIGVSKDYIERINYLERTGGFCASRYMALGPYQNGYEVESKILAQLKELRIIGEWHLVSYEDAVAVAKQVAHQVGNSNLIDIFDSDDLIELVDDLFPLKSSVINDEQLQDISITGFVDEKRVLWFETDECGIFLPEFFMGFLRAEELSRGGSCDEHK
jgi:hypothetical protein